MPRNGFSLIEALVALGIVALGLALALPWLPSGPSGLELDGAARQIAAGLREARAAAIAGNRPVDFRIDLASGVYGHDWPRQMPRRQGGIQLALYTTDGLRLGASAGSIRFFPDGASTGGGIELSAGERRQVVLVDWLSGGVTVPRNRDAGGSR